jgi:cytidine deaminase
VTDDAWHELERAARSARDHAYAPYSGFQVGAALRAADGSIFVGCNVENASYGATICAERAALAAAVAAGARELVALAIVTAGADPTPPCGICRQSLFELSEELVIRSFTPNGEATYTLAQLLPHPFGEGHL